MNLCKDPESWARVDPEAVVGCSHGHAVYVLKMALLDIAKLAATQTVGGHEALAWHCCDERYPWIQGIVTSSEITLDAWRDSGIKYQPLYPLAPQPSPAATVETDADLPTFQDVRGILPRCSAATEHASWDDANYQRARDTMVDILRRNSGWSITTGDLTAFDNAFQHAVGILSLTAQRLPNEPQAAPVRSWTGPGHLEESGYIDKQERCPTCERTDRQYKLGRERGHHGLCRDAWHADDHLRASQLTRPQSRSGE